MERAKQLYPFVTAWAVQEHTGPRITSGSSAAQLAVKVKCPCRLQLMRDGDTFSRETIHVIPKPNSAEQDVKPLFDVSGVKGGIEELVDNGINALLGKTNRSRLQRKGVPRLWVEFIDNAQHRDKAMLVIQDNGVGMSVEILSKYLVEASTFSRIPEIKRYSDTPILLSSFINPDLNRYGQGCNVLTGFGNEYKITTREIGDSMTHILEADMDEWKDDYANGGTGWKSTLCHVTNPPGTPLSPLPTNVTVTPGRSALALPHGTQICISRLKDKVLEELRDGQTIKRLRAQIAQDYFLFISGMPEWIFDRMPEKFRPEGQRSDLSMMIFGTELNATTLDKLPDDEMPVLFKTLTAYSSLKSLTQKGPGNRPFMLHLRYVPDALKGDKLTRRADEDDDECSLVTENDPQMAELKAVSIAARKLLEPHLAGKIGRSAAAPGSMSAPPKSTHGGGQNKGKGRASMGGAGGSYKGGTPAATARGKGGAGTSAGARGSAGTAARRAPRDDDDKTPHVPLTERDPVAEVPARYVDILLVLLYFPVENGVASKPNAENGASQGNWELREPFVWPFWSGRLMPQCELMKELPRLVKQAVELGKEVQEVLAFKNNDKHLCGLALFSPDCNVTNHKTNFSDPAFTAFTDMGPKPAAALSRIPAPCHPPGTMHVYNCELETYMPDPNGAMATRMLLTHFQHYWSKLDEEGAILDLTHVFDSRWRTDEWHEEGTLYKMSKFDDPIRVGEIVRTKDATDEVGSGSDAQGRKEFAKDYFIVTKFYKFGRDADHEHCVELQRWVPSWITPSHSDFSLPKILEMAPIPLPKYVARMAKGNELMTTWEQDKTPHHIAFLRRAGDGAAAGGPGGKGSARSRGDKGDKDAVKGKRETTVATRDADGPAVAEGGVAAGAGGASGSRSGGSDAAAAAQLPVFSKSATVSGDRLHVVLASKSGKPLSKAGVSCNFDPADVARPAAKLAKQVLSATLTRTGTHQPLWLESFAPADGAWHEYEVSGFGAKCEVAGTYTLTLEVADESKLLASTGTSLVYKFRVAAAAATELTARFVDGRGAEGAVEKMRLGRPARTLLLGLSDAQGNSVAFPKVKDDVLFKAVQLEVNVLDGVSSSWELLATGATVGQMSLSSDRMMLSIDGFTVPGQPIREAEGERSVEAKLAVGMSGAPLPPKLKAASVPCMLFASTASKIVFADSTEPYEARAEIAKGETLRSKAGEVPVFSLEDEWGNAYMHGEVESDPAPKALVVKVTATHVAMSGAPLHADYAKVDKASGHISLPGDLIAHGPVGSFATVSLFVEALGITADKIINRLIFPVHLGFNHPMLTKAGTEGAATSADRPSTSGSNDVIAAYILDTLERTKKYSKEHKMEVISRHDFKESTQFKEGLEERPNGSVIRPNGEYYSYADIDKLVKQLNDDIKCDAFLHEVAVVVAPGARKVTGLSVQVCKDDDSVDKDWSAAIKMKLLCGKKVKVLPDLQYNRGALKVGGSSKRRSATAAAAPAGDVDDGPSFEQPFEVELPPNLFDGDNAAATASIVFYDCDSNLEYGRCYVRQVCQPSRSLLLPIGRAFIGTTLRDSQKEARGSGARGASQAQGGGAANALPIEGVLSNECAQAAATLTSPGDDGPDPLATLAGWKLMAAGAAREKLYLDHFGCGRTLSVLPPGLPVHARQPFRLYFVCPDAYGIPMELPDALCKEAALTVAVMATGASAEKSASRGGKGRAHHAPAHQARVVEGSWIESELNVSTGKGVTEYTWPVPVYSFEVAIEAGCGPTTLSFHLRDPAERTTRNTTYVLDLGTVQVPLKLVAARMAPDGYLITGSRGATVRMLSAANAHGGRVALLPGGAAGPSVGSPDEAADGGKRARRATHEATAAAAAAAAAAASGAGPSGARAGAADDGDATSGSELWCEVCVAERSEGEVDITLTDEDKEPLGPLCEGEFTLSCASLGPQWQQRKVLVEGGKITLEGLAAAACSMRSGGRGAGTGSATGSSQGGGAGGSGDAGGDGATVHVLTLRPACDVLMHARSMHMRLVVAPGHYPQRLVLVPHELWGKASSDGEPEGVEHITVDLSAGAPEMNMPPRSLPKLSVIAADGALWAAPSAARIQLTWCMEDGALGPKVPAVAPHSEDAAAGAGPSSSHAAAGAALPWPTKAGMWRLEAALKDGDTTISLTMAEALVLAGPPVSFLIDDDTARRLAERRFRPYPEKTVVQRQGNGGSSGGPSDIPMISGSLVDCYGNTARCGCQVLVVVQLWPEGSDDVANTAKITGTYINPDNDLDFVLTFDKTLLTIIPLAEKKLLGLGDDAAVSGARSYHLILSAQPMVPNQPHQPAMCKHPVATLLVTSASEAVLCNKLEESKQQVKMIRQQRVEAERAKSETATKTVALERLCDNLQTDFQNALGSLRARNLSEALSIYSKQSDEILERLGDGPPLAQLDARCPRLMSLVGRL
ncbi:hypothetical protein FOA52_000817 [Chlamydomonas sp. UWO 241]|nr:hypothetical protein FOA52_000817 [Chlamydomonas sp. UWO 241]